MLRVCLGLLTVCLVVITVLIALDSPTVQGWRDRWELARLEREQVEFCRSAKHLPNPRELFGARYNVCFNDPWHR